MNNKLQHRWVATVCDCSSDGQVGHPKRPHCPQMTRARHCFRLFGWMSQTSLAAMITRDQPMYPTPSSGTSRIERKGSSARREPPHNITSKRRSELFTGQLRDLNFDEQRGRARLLEFPTIANAPTRTRPQNRAGAHFFF